MPTYGYECKSCKHTFDAFQGIMDEPLKECPKCKKELRRLINGGAGIVFKGGGFYVNEKSGSSSTKTASSSNASESASCASCAQSEACPAAV